MEAELVAIRRWQKLRWLEIVPLASIILLHVAGASGTVASMFVVVVSLIVLDALILARMSRLLCPRCHQPFFGRMFEAGFRAGHMWVSCIHCMFPAKGPV